MSVTGASEARHVLPRAVGLFRPHRRQLLLLLLVVVVGAAVGIVNPLLTKVVFDDALFPAEGEPRLGLLTVLVGVMVVAVAVASALAIWQAYLAAVMGQHVMHGIRERLFAHLNRLSLRFFTGARTGEVQARITQDVDGLGSVVSAAVPSIVANSVFVLASLVAMLILSWPLTLASVVVLPGFVYVSYRIGRTRRALLSQRQQTIAEMSVLTEETLSVSGMLLTKVFDRHEQTVDRYRRESRTLADVTVRQQMAGRVILGVAQSFILVGPAIIYLAAGYLQSSFSISPGTVVAFTALQMRLLTPIRDLMERSIEVHQSLALFERIFEYLDLPHEITDAPGARALEPGSLRGAVAFRDVFLRYGGSSQWALEDVSFRIEPGQLAAIVGPTGAGKTSVTYLIARLYDPSRGSVEVDGMDVRQIQQSSLTSNIGMVTQETTLFHTSIRENLLYAKPEATEEELEAATRAASIHEHILSLDAGYDTIVGERGYRMSGGEKQRLAIARVLLRDPAILILDEATSALDTASERLVQGALERLTEGRTTIAIAHRLSTILAADVILVLDRGRLVEQGTHAELLAHGGLYAELYEHQFHNAEPAGGGAGASPAPARHGEGGI